MIDHRTGDWKQTDDEIAAVHHIDLAINEIIKASIDDGKLPKDHPRVDERPDHIGRLHEAFDFLQRARKDVNQEEDDSFANGLKNRAIVHISEAMKFTQHAIKA
jgi:hypothetical protein